MRLSTPKLVTFWIAVILALLGLIGFLGVVAALYEYAFWFVFIGFVVLAIGNLFKDI